MPFGLTNALAVFQHMMNDVFQEFLDQFVIIYIDDILIFSKNEEEHKEHVRLVLQKLREMGEYAKLEKCMFYQLQVEFLGYIISGNGISMDPHKVATILDWKIPKTIRDIQCFIGFSNFYRIFIRNFSNITAPLTELIKKDKLQWTHTVQEAFTTLKNAFFSAPILIHADLTQPFIIEADASDFALGCPILSQVGSDDKLHPVSYYSRKFSAPKINYEIYDKELLAIVAAF
jgi:hypothetical protein